MASVGLFWAVVAVAGILGAAAWVYRDARAQSRAGNPVTYSMGDLHIKTPAGWFLACALVFELFIPVYLDNRRPA